MDYQEAEKIRKKSFGTLLGEQEGGLGSSLKSAISQKTKAKITGIKETFDPMNMARAVGGKTGAAIYGKIFKRDDASMERFAGAKKKKTISDSAGTDEKVGEHSTPSDVLGLIYRLMLRANDEKKTQEIDDLEKKKADEKEENDRNEQIIKAITGRTKKKPTRKEKAKEKKEEVKEKKEAKKEEGKKPPTERKKAPPTEKGKKPPAEKAPPKEAPKPTAKKEPEVPKEAPKAPKAPEVAKPPTPKPTAGKLGPAATTAAAGLTGKAAQVAVALSTLGITSKAAIGAIVATSAKESGLDPFKPEDGVKPWRSTLEKRGVDYLYLKFPQLAPGGRVAKQLNMPNGVSADYIRQVMDKGDEAWFTLVYPGGADAYKYRGRGLIQITGKDNYKKIGDIIGVDLVNNPDAITQDFSTAARATGAYMMNSLGRGDSKKGLEALNNFTDEQEALKVVIANVASGGIGTDKQRIDKIFDPNTNIGKTTASQLQAAQKYSTLGSDAASGKKIDDASKENKDLKQTASKDANAQTLNNTTNIKQQASSPPPQKSGDDRNAYLKKAQG